MTVRIAHILHERVLDLILEIKNIEAILEKAVINEEAIVPTNVILIVNDLLTIDLISETITAMGILSGPSIRIDPIIPIARLILSVHSIGINSALIARTTVIKTARMNDVAPSNQVKSKTQRTIHNVLHHPHA
jgi:hypothetical protein